MKRIITLLAVAALSTTSLFAQTADEVIDKYFEAVGGREAMAAVKTVKMTGKIKVQGMELPITMVNTNKGQQRMSFSFQGQEIVQPAFDGNEGWQTNFMTMKAEKMEAEDNAIMKAEAGDFPDAFLDYKGKGYSIALEADETIEGVACHKIKLTKKPVTIDGKEEENFSYYFFDKENNVPIMVRSIIKKGQMKGMASESFMSDYQEVNGVMFPFTIDQKFNGQSQAAIAIEKVDVNVTIDEAIFKFPN